jgi:hypothetical protein
MPGPLPQEALHLRHRVQALYRQLLYLLPILEQPLSKTRPKLKNAFLRNAAVDTSQQPGREQVEEMIKRGEYVAKELEALWFLKKYRAMKKRYET